ncbi:uncharacterized protein LOC131255517 isoform X2 [Magnolia sinica]|uniref:uncharacterized protein LOC131255517 isoform X2 n=1 Tax=Magnolia sinica TaxID=86752 RepID=UPI002658F03B|nr:uncharacterized protein LOC131255517 isoform X2 [Magnolia sinica]
MVGLPSMPTSTLIEAETQQYGAEELQSIKQIRCLLIIRLPAPCTGGAHGGRISNPLKLLQIFSRGSGSCAAVATVLSGQVSLTIYPLFRFHLI